MTHEPGEQVFNALADSTRRTLIGYLSQHETATATELAAGLPVTRQAITKHLNSLEEAGLVDRQRVGRETRYSLTPQPLTDAMAWMASVGAQWDKRLQRLRRSLEREGS